MSKHEEWKNDEEFRCLLLEVSEEATADEVVAGLRYAAHVANQESLLASIIYTAALSKKTRELYLLHGIDPSCLDPVDVACRNDIDRRERYKANGYKGEW